MRVLEIVKEWLKSNGYGGLYSGECGCCLDDLAPCSCMDEDCEPGYKKIKTEACKKDCMFEEDCEDFCIVKEKPNA